LISQTRFWRGQGAFPGEDWRGFGNRTERTEMKPKFFCSLAGVCVILNGLRAGDITTLDGQTYANVRDVMAKPNGLFFVVGTDDSMKGVTVAYTNLTDPVREEYRCDAYDLGLALARQNQAVDLNKNLAFSLDQLEAARKKAKDEHKLLGFIMTWDSFFVPAHPMGHGSDSALADFYDVFKDSLVLVFVRHENELDKVPAAVKQGFLGPEEGGFAPNMAVVTADGSEFVCEIPYGGKYADGATREHIFLQKITVIKKFLKTQDRSK
jgi:hypothetical protein